MNPVGPEQAPEQTIVRFDDVAPVPDALFRTWVSGGDATWARHAWGVLEQGGLTTVGVGVDRTTVVVRLLALWALGRDFYALRFGEGDPGTWVYELGEVVGLPGGVDRSWLYARWCEHYVVDQEDDDQDYLTRLAAEELLPDLVRDEAVTVGSTLRRVLGDATLFASLCASSTEASFPLDADEVAEWVGATTTEAHQAYEWIDGGMDL